MWTFPFIGYALGPVIMKQVNELEKYRTWARINGYSHEAIAEALASAQREAATRVEKIDVIALAKDTLTGGRHV